MATWSMPAMVRISVRRGEAEAKMSGKGNDSIETGEKCGIDIL